MTLPRPSTHLSLYGRRYAGAWGIYDEFRAGRGKGFPAWPEWCFAPLSAAYSIIGKGQRLSMEQAVEVGRLGALATWRITQGVYRIDPDVFDAVWKTPIDGAVPVELLQRLPEWCVYVETPGRTFEGQVVHGFFAHLEYDTNDGHSELRLLLDADTLAPFPIHLREEATLDQALKDSFAFAAKNAVRHGFNLTGLSDTARAASILTPFISTVLYLCSISADYRSADGLLTRPPRPTPKKTKQGIRLFPTPKPTVWETGYALGSALRRAIARIKSAPNEGAGRITRPHIRRAHFHAYWVGPRKQPEQRRLELRWLPPIAVMVEDYGALVPVVRGVGK